MQKCLDANGSTISQKITRITYACFDPAFQLHTKWKNCFSSEFGYFLQPQRPALVMVHEGNEALELASRSFSIHWYYILGSRHNVLDISSTELRAGIICSLHFKHRPIHERFLKRYRSNLMDAWKLIVESTCESPVGLNTNINQGSLVAYVSLEGNIRDQICIEMVRRYTGKLLSGLQLYRHVLYFSAMSACHYAIELKLQAF